MGSGDRVVAPVICSWNFAELPVRSDLDFSQGPPEFSADPSLGIQHYCLAGMASGPGGYRFQDRWLWSWEQEAWVGAAVGGA